MIETVPKGMEDSPAWQADRHLFKFGKATVQGAAVTLFKHEEADLVRHIVMWKLRDKADAALLKARLEALNGRIPGLVHLEVGMDFLASAQSADLVLVADLENREALDSYQAHPEHQAVVPLVREAAASRTVVDYET